MKKSFWTIDKPTETEQTTFRGKSPEEYSLLFDKMNNQGRLTPKRIKYFQYCIAKSRLGRQNLRTFSIYMLRVMIFPAIIGIGMLIKTFFN